MECFQFPIFVGNGSLNFLNVTLLKIDKCDMIQACFPSQGVIRICQLQELVEWLCQIPESRLGKHAVSKKHGPFYLRAKTQKDKEPSARNSREQDDERDTGRPPAVNLERKKVMENMAQLWLEQEVGPFFSL